MESYRQAAETGRQHTDRSLRHPFSLQTQSHRAFLREAKRSRFRPQRSRAKSFGADLLNGTPIYDIKPYLPYADSFPDAKSGFASSVPKRTEVEFSCSVPGGISDEMLADIRELLKQDPRPAYQRDPGRIYGMKYAGVEIKFKGSEEKITVCDISFYPSI